MILTAKILLQLQNRTIDSVFVTIHRINKKLDFINKAVVDTLKELVNRDKEENSVQLPPFRINITLTLSIEHLPIL